MNLKKKILLLLSIFVLWTILSVLQKPVFLLLHAGGVTQAWTVVEHGLGLDLSVAGYLTAIPGLLLLTSSVGLRALHTPRATRVMGIIMRIWIGVAAMLLSMSFAANIALYGYWQFPLDATPIFFITSSPKDAMASVQWWQGAAGVAAVAVLTWAAYRLFCLLLRRFEPQAYRPVAWWGNLAMLVAVGALFLPIRGGVTVAAINTGSVYFSENPRLNHAAVNPLFSFLESMSHQSDFASQYHFMDDKQAARLVAPMLNHTSMHATAGRDTLLTVSRPDIYLIVLESFSDTLTRQPNVTPHLNGLKREGIYFSRFYANSFRTDRGLVATLLGYPAPATVSLMKFPNKTARIPSLSGHLKRSGWGLKYYYGGDADFTNMRSFLVNQGFDDVVEDLDFPVAERLSKWGVPDHLLFRRVEQELAADHSHAPRFRVIQTSSSHEPFDVPYNRLKDKALNAFAYADSCVGGFVRYLKVSGRWNRSLVLLVPDHLGAWPQEPDNFKSWRFHVPMIWTGGALGRRGVTGTYGSQQDIAATLLACLGIDHRDMRFSKDLLHHNSPHFAFFMMNDGFGIVDDSTEVIYDHKLRKTVVSRGPERAAFLAKGKAYTQMVYKDISEK